MSKLHEKEHSDLIRKLLAPWGAKSRDCRDIHTERHHGRIGSTGPDSSLRIASKSKLANRGEISSIKLNVKISLNNSNSIDQ